MFPDWSVVRVNSVVIDPAESCLKEMESTAILLEFKMLAPSESLSKVKFLLPSNANVIWTSLPLIFLFFLRQGGPKNSV